MKRMPSIAVIIAGIVLLGVALSGPSAAVAQTYARRDVPAGEVTGLEMSIDGAMRAVPGGRLTWLVTVYEVMRRRDLRPARDVALSVTASFAPGSPVFAARTDASGRAELHVELPPDLEEAPEVIVEAVSQRGIRRTFDARIELAPTTRVELFVDRDRVAPGGSVLAFGRVRDGRDGAMLGDAEITLAVTAGGAALRAPRVLRSDARGVFWALVELPEREAQIEISASTEDDRRAIGLVVARTRPEPLWVRAIPARALAAPGDAIDVDVEVRDATGAPVGGARVDWTDAPRGEDEPLRTDADGRARLRWDIDRRSIAAGWEDRSREIRAVHPGYGAATGSAGLRVARRASFATWSVEGGALVPGLESRVYARITEADGSVRAGRSVRLEGARLGAPRVALTDADGVVALDALLSAGEAIDACGGPTATEATLVVDGVPEVLCLPIDPDATLAVRARGGDVAGAVVVAVQRRADVARSAVVVTALVERDGAWAPIGRATIGAAQSSATIALGARPASAVWVRARPVLGDGQEVRGGGALLWLGDRAPRAELTALGTGGADGVVGGALDAPSTRALFAVDPQRARSLRSAFIEALGPLGAALAEGRGDLYVAALAASRVPLDEAASAVLREGRVEPLPLPDQAVALGLLRDPWRTRARFVRGRLGSLMRAVEAYVDARVPGSIEQVAVREGATWRFDREVLEAALEESGLGDERAAALDGEPLDIDALTTLDPAFTYDHVAARITRQRLFRLLGLLRELVRDRELDLEWARRGDPRQYPLSLLEADVPWRDVQPERAHLFDAWGTPFALVATRGRPRFALLQPVSGFELVSAGPDGRFGTRDDLADPFARILASGGVYAEAAGEDVLIARVRLVALGRATVETLVETFGIEANEWEATLPTAPAASWDGAPPHLAALALAPAPVPLLVAAIGEVRVAAPGVATTIGWTLPRERRPYVAMGLVFTDGGGVAWDTRSFEAGARIAARFDPPEVMRPGEELRIPLSMVRLAAGPSPRARITATGDAIAARVEGDVVVLEARAMGIGSLELRLEDGETPWITTHRVRVLPAGALRARHAGAIVAPEASLDLGMPSGARAWRGRLVIGAPQSLRRDPLFADAASERAAIAAWADVIGGSAVDPEHLAALERGGPADAPALSTACALVVWAAQPERTLFADRAAQRLGSELPSDLGARAAILAALAPAASAIVDGSTADPVASVIAGLREDGWRALASERDRPSVMARTAAALLLADRGDSIGRALFERARDAATSGVGLDPSTPDAFVGTLALAIAARQLGDDATADALAPELLRRVYLAPQLGTEAVFWALAASAYGALGAGAPETIEVEIDGTVQQVTLVDGARELAVRPGASIRVRASSPLWARAESRTIQALVARDDAPMTPRLEGDVGRAGERAALELVLESTIDEEIAAPVLEIALPSAASFDDAARAGLEASPAVVRVDGPDGAGIVRLHLAPLRGRASHHVPLPLRWRGAGSSRGLSLVAYEGSRPWAQTIRPERVLEVEAP